MQKKKDTNICNHDLEYAYTRNEALPYGNINSIAVFKCIKCGEEFNEWEIDSNNKRTDRA